MCGKYRYRCLLGWICDPRDIEQYWLKICLQLYTLTWPDCGDIGYGCDRVTVMEMELVLLLISDGLNDSDWFLAVEFRLASFRRIFVGLLSK